MKYLIVYESKTGNTRFLAETLHLFLKDEVGKNISIEIMTVSEFNDAPVDADVYFVGFGTNKGKIRKHGRLCSRISEIGNFASV